MDFPSSLVDDGYLEILIVAQALVTEMLRKLLAVCDSLKIAVEVDPDPISKRDAIFYIKKELSHCRTSNRFSLEDHERDATIENGLPRFRALARITVTDRFSENGDANGGRAVIDQRNQVRSLGRCPFSANAHHGDQSGVPAFVPK